MRRLCALTAAGVLATATSAQASVRLGLAAPKPAPICQPRVGALGRIYVGAVSSSTAICWWTQAQVVYAITHAKMIITWNLTGAGGPGPSPFQINGIQSIQPVGPTRRARGVTLAARWNVVPAATLWTNTVTITDPNQCNGKPFCVKTTPTYQPQGSPGPIGPLCLIPTSSFRTRPLLSGTFAIDAWLTANSSNHPIAGAATDSGVIVGGCHNQAEDPLDEILADGIGQFPTQEPSPHP